MNPTLKKHSNNCYTWVEVLKEEAFKNDTDCKQALVQGPNFKPPPKHAKFVKRQENLVKWLRKQTS